MMDTFLIDRALAVACRLAKARCWYSGAASFGSGLSTKWFDLNPADVEEAIIRLREFASAAAKIEWLTEALADVVGNANEAMKYGPFDCIDNTGQPYQSKTFQRALDNARNLLRDAALTEGRE